MLLKIKWKFNINTIDKRYYVYYYIKYNIIEKIIRYYYNKLKHSYLKITKIIKSIKKIVNSLI